MVAAAWARRARDFCVETAAAAAQPERRALEAASSHLREGWPSQADTLGQELVFAQVAFFTKYWSQENRSQLPPEAVALSRDGEKQIGQQSWWRSVRRSLFGGFAAREHCLTYAQAFPVLDSSPAIADPALRKMGEPPFFRHLADWDDSPAGSDQWVTLFRRVRGLETELELLRAGLAVWKLRDAEGSWPNSLAAEGPFIDGRTGQPLRLETTGGAVALVARGDSSLAAGELRVPLSAAR